MKLLEGFRELSPVKTKLEELCKAVPHTLPEGFYKDKLSLYFTGIEGQRPIYTLKLGYKKGTPTCLETRMKYILGKSQPCSLKALIQLARTIYFRLKFNDELTQDEMESLVNLQK